MIIIIITIVQIILILEQQMVIQHILDKITFHVIIVKKISLAPVIFSKMNIRIVSNVMKIDFPMFVKNVDEKLALIPKIFPIKIDIGMKNVSSVLCVKVH